LPAFLAAAVRLATMPNILDPDLALFLIDLVEHSVIPRPGSQDAGQADNRLHASWPWILCEFVDNQADSPRYPRSGGSGARKQEERHAVVGAKLRGSWDW